MLNWFPWEIVVLIYVRGHSNTRAFIRFYFCNRMRIFHAPCRQMHLNEKTLAVREKRKIYNEKFIHRFYINGNIYMYFVLAVNTRKAPCITRTTNNRGSTIWKQGNTRQPREKTLLQRNKLEHPRMLCDKFGRNWFNGSGEEYFLISSMYFHHFVMISPWKRAGPSFEQT